MGRYKALQPVAFMCGDKAVTAWVGAVFELDDDVAKKLVRAGKLEPLGFIAGPDVPEPESKPEVVEPVAAVVSVSRPRRARSEKPDTEKSNTGKE